MSTGTPSHDSFVTAYKDAPARAITTDGVTYAYRELGPRGGIPVVFFIHLAATLDNWDPRIVDAVAATRHVSRSTTAASVPRAARSRTPSRRWPTTH